jgi:hypothetical protein
MLLVTERTLSASLSNNPAMAAEYRFVVLRPLFRSNHAWAMTRGERQLQEYLARS